VSREKIVGRRLFDGYIGSRLPEPKIGKLKLDSLWHGWAMWRCGSSLGGAGRERRTRFGEPGPPKPITIDMTMTDDARGRQRKHGRLWLALALLALLLAVLIVPPWIGLSQYKSRITQLLAASLGRPVRLSSVELRLLPRPAFVLTDLTVEEDPAYGAEPVLHANTVTASFRLLSLWRGRLEIGTISVDEASLNLVRTDAGRWNMDSLFRTAAAHAGAAPSAGSVGGEFASGSGKPPLPYLEATNSRINIKIGSEKLPFSLVSTDLSFWQEEPGSWRIRLRGQPARTDVSLDLADTGVVRLEASVHRAAELREMPVHLDLEWREAQLGQLTRLVIGSDPGWRGDLTGQLHLDGTADAAQITTRLRATGVHRAEFAPAAPMDFDANCGLVYHFSERAVEKLICDSPLGDGRIRLTGDLPGQGGLPQLSVELDRIPVAFGLDALRTVRSGLGPGLEAKGTISGKIAYAEVAPASGVPEKPTASTRQSASRAGRDKPVNALAVEASPLTGSLTLEGLQLSGDGLNVPIQAPRMVFAPVAYDKNPQPDPHHRNSPAPPQGAALSATVAIPAGAATPLSVTLRLALTGYQVTVRGQASLAGAKELAHVTGLPEASVLDSLAGDPVSVDLSAAGPWQPAQRVPFSSDLPAGAVAPAAANIKIRPALPPSGTDAVASPETDTLSGTVTLRNANWKAAFLANYVEITQATLHLGNGVIRWDPVAFAYGPVRGTASLSLPVDCGAPPPCLPQFQVQFGALDAGTLQSAILGAHEQGTLLSALIARLRPSNSSSAPAWPDLEGTVKADSLILGPLTLRDATATLRVLPTGAEITGLDASLLGGRVHGSGTLRTAATDQGKPSYTLEGQFEKLSPASVGQLLRLHFTGGNFDADGKIDLSGFTSKDLADSAKGTLRFEWRNGSAGAPPALAHFDRWSGDAEIADGAVTLKQSEAQHGVRKEPVVATLTFGDPPKAVFAAPAPKETAAKKPSAKRR